MMSNVSTRLIWKQKSKLVKAFHSAKSIDKMLKLFKELEKLFPESDLGIYCWNLSIELHQQHRSPDQVLSIGNRTLRIFVDNETKGIPFFGNMTLSAVWIGVMKNGSRCFRFHNSSLYIAHLCNVLASASLKLKRYDECLSYLNWADRNLTKLLLENDDTGCYCLLHTFVNTHRALFRVKPGMARFEQVVCHLKKQLKMIKGEGCIELAEEYKYLSSAYMHIMNYEEPLPFYLKALEIYIKHYGCNSVKVADMTYAVAFLYNQLGEHEKALEQNELSRNIMKRKDPSSPELLEAEASYGDILIGLGRYEEAIDVLKAVVSHTDMKENERGFAYVYMAKAFCYLEKFADAKKHMRTAQRIFEKKEISDFSDAIQFRDMSRCYEKMNDFEKAISLLRRVLSIPQIPLKFVAEDSARLLSLLSLSGKERERISYIEDMVKKLEENFGPERCEVGHGYKNLGAAYLKSGQEELAMKFMAKAKNIMDVALGPHHLDSLKTSQNLAETYVTLRRYEQAKEIQCKVVESLKGMCPSEQKFLDEAVTCLNNMKERESDEVAESSQVIDGGDLSAKSSKGVV